MRLRYERHTPASCTFATECDVPKSKGHLNPGLARGRAGTIRRRARARRVGAARLDRALATAAGEVSQQRVLTYPTFNLVISTAPRLSTARTRSCRCASLPARGGRSGCCCARRGAAAFPGRAGRAGRRQPAGERRPDRRGREGDGRAGPRRAPRGADHPLARRRSRRAWTIRGGS